jgi:ubiquinone/menaquinone biosynthesis C-methylase UbiE
MPAQQVRHPLFARFYARLSRGMEGAGVGRIRAQLLADLSGSVLEAGAGNGLNFSHYPATVTSVLAVEPEPHLRGIAERAAAAAPVPVKVVDGTAEQLPADDASFDAVVATLMLCSVSDVAATIAELRRVLRPGGKLIFMEHVRADSPGLRRVQRLADATIWPFCFGNCHAARDPVAALTDGGFSIVSLTQYRLPETGLPWPTTPHARGVAVRA